MSTIAWPASASATSGQATPGAFARSLQECLALQLKEQNRFDPVIAAFLANLHLLASHNFPALKKAVGVEMDELSDMIGELKQLNPKPGLAFGSTLVQPIVPDVFVRLAPDGGFIWPVIAATTLAFFAMVGFEDSVNMAEETEDPVNTFPKILLAGLFITGVIYVLVSISAITLVPPDQLGEGETPFAVLMHLAMIGDVTSLYLAELNGVDPSSALVVSRPSLVSRTMSMTLVRSPVLLRPALVSVCAPEVLYFLPVPSLTT